MCADGWREVKIWIHAQPMNSDLNLRRQGSSSSTFCRHGAQLAFVIVSATVGIDCFRPLLSSFGHNAHHKQRMTCAAEACSLMPKAKGAGDVAVRWERPLMQTRFEFECRFVFLSDAGFFFTVISIYTLNQIVLRDSIR